MYQWCTFTVSIDQPPNNGTDKLSRTGGNKLTNAASKPKTRRCHVSRLRSNHYEEPQISPRHSGHCLRIKLQHSTQVPHAFLCPTAQLNPKINTMDQSRLILFANKILIHAKYRAENINPWSLRRHPLPLAEVTETTTPIGLRSLNIKFTHYVIHAGHVSSLDDLCLYKYTLIL